MQVKVLVAELSGGVQIESKDANTIVLSNGKRLSFDVNLDELAQFLKLHREHMEHMVPVPAAAPCKDKDPSLDEAATMPAAG